MKAIKIIAFLLTLCMLSSLLLACNSVEPPSDSETPSDTSATDNPTEAPTEKPTAPVEESDLKHFIEITQYNGREFDELNIDIGQDSCMHVVKNTSLEEYEKFKTDLETQGFVLYTTNEIGQNKFATYITVTQIVNVMLIYYDYDETNKTDFGGKAAVDHYEVRVMEDNRYVFDLPGLEKENVYKDSGYASFSMISDDKLVYPGRMGYVYQLTDGSFFIIDGGITNDDLTKSSAPVLMALLEEFAPDPNNIVIAGWLMTHIHDDHMGAYYDIARNEEYLSKIKVEKLICNVPSESEIAIQDKYKWNESTQDISTTINKNEGTTERQDQFNEATAKIRPDQQVKAHPGQVLYIRDLTLTIYCSQDLLLYSTIPSASTPKNFESNPWHNSASIVSMINYQGKDMLFFADSHVYSFKYMISPIYRNLLKADVLQVAHHGYQDTRADLVNKYIQPDYVLWPARRGHYDGKNSDGSIYYESGKAYNGVATLNFNSVFVNDPSIVQVYHANDNCVTVKDFSTSQWSFYEWDPLP